MHPRPRLEDLPVDSLAARLVILHVDGPSAALVRVGRELVKAIRRDGVSPWARRCLDSISLPSDPDHLAAAFNRLERA